MTIKNYELRIKNFELRLPADLSAEATAMAEALRRQELRMTNLKSHIPACKF